MKISITTEFIRSLVPAPPDAVRDAWAKGQSADVYDTRQPQLVLRARASGVHSYVVRLRRGKWHTLGKASGLTPEKARGLARKALGDVAFGKDPSTEKKRARTRTLAEHLEKVYRPWLIEHKKSGARIADEIASAFPSLARVKLDGITAWHVEKWRRDRLATTVRGKRVQPATVNRNIGYLKTLLNRACAWGHLEAHPLAKVKPLPEDRIGVLRFLSPEEDARLRAALETRDTARRTKRESANLWRRQRGYAEWPPGGTYTDHLTPLVLLALNTGLRFGELTGLCWKDVDRVRQILTVRSEYAKSGKARRVPLNSDALSVLATWRPTAVVDVDAYVFPGPEGERLVDVKTAWARLLKSADITAFRFHDLRHTFASNLVMAGVDLNTVRELLGHADIKMTLRYAHLAPEHTAAAVAKLSKGA